MPLPSGNSPAAVTLGSATFTDRDIWMAAIGMIEDHGDLAAIEASKIADTFLTDGDLAGQRIWIRVVRAITEMTDPQPTGQAN